jgi:hypothetical protein
MFYAGASEDAPLHWRFVMAEVESVTLPLPLLFGIVATRAALGVGIGLLLADKLKEKRYAVGATLVAIGAVTTVPAVMALMRARNASALGNI